MISILTELVELGVTSFTRFPMVREDSTNGGHLDQIPLFTSTEDLVKNRPVLSLWFAGCVLGLANQIQKTPNANFGDQRRRTH